MSSNGAIQATRPIHSQVQITFSARVIVSHHHALVTILAVEDLLPPPMEAEMAVAADDSRLMPPDISLTDMAAADCSLLALRSASASAFGEFISQISKCHEFI